MRRHISHHSYEHPESENSTLALWSIRFCQCDDDDDEIFVLSMLSEINLILNSEHAPNHQITRQSTHTKNGFLFWPTNNGKCLVSIFFFLGEMETNAIVWCYCRHFIASEHHHCAMHLNNNKLKHNDPLTMTAWQHANYVNSRPCCRQSRWQIYQI